MNELLDRLRAQLAQRTPRERWILVALGCALAVVLVQVIVVGPANARRDAALGQARALDGDVQRAQLLVREVELIRDELAAVKERIKPGEKTNLLATLESLGRAAGISGNIDSLKPKTATGNSEFPETRVEVSLREVDLNQLVSFLSKIEGSSSHLIIRSLRIQKRAGKQEGSATLDVTFSVSSFERAT